MQRKDKCCMFGVFLFLLQPSPPPSLGYLFLRGPGRVFQCFFHRCFWSFFDRVFDSIWTHFGSEFALKNASKYDVFFHTVLGLLFGAFPIPSGLHFGALACTRLHFSHFHVSRKVIKNVLICHCFWLPFCFKNASKMSAFFALIFQPFFFTF